MGKPVRVLVVDDMAVVRRILCRGLSKHPEIEVVGSAADAYTARDLIVELDPDVITLDVEMPRMNGVEFLRRLMPQHPMPVVMVSSLTRKGDQTTLDALEAGAIDFVTKPLIESEDGLDGMMCDLEQKIMAAAGANMDAWARPKPRPSIPSKTYTGYCREDCSGRVIAIGASTGGTEAILSVLQQLPADVPGILVVQHMPAGYTKRFAERLDQLCPMRVREATEGDVIEPGLALVAPGDRHLEVNRKGSTYSVNLKEQNKVSGHRPSVDVLFESVAANFGDRGVGVLLTGMGMDGATGLLSMRNAGARTIAQDEMTSVVFGMPKAAIAIGAAEHVSPLYDIATAVMESLH